MTRDVQKPKRYRKTGRDGVSRDGAMAQPELRALPCKLPAPSRRRPLLGLLVPSGCGGPELARLVGADQLGGPSIAPRGGAVLGLELLVLDTPYSCPTAVSRFD